METRVDSFYIEEIVYDAGRQKLTYRFKIDGSSAQRIVSGFLTAEEIAEDIRQILSEYYAKA